eukprot:CAMPEP_0182906260 /NCGR_PEP_ID=MMETSP0034_2-20130328/33604_1 /TAXON_ID=156128 /ORGANISM="Nephroselmis pyriformis, Strain CCMP717" /LENGTH=84 /DNA_ID=CAMNT_0025041891 /DNA_START=28 /DNA_END=278 /DNA_ORIENTATION=+
MRAAPGDGEPGNGARAHADGFLPHGALAVCRRRLDREPAPPPAVTEVLGREELLSLITSMVAGTLSATGGRRCASCGRGRASLA